jgi:hypothetical protein
MWFPPPALACQVISFILDAWVEKPLTISALIFVPQVIQAFWWGLCCHLLTELTMLYPYLTPLCFQPLVSLPVVICTYHLTSILCPPRTGWTTLPCPPGTLAPGTSHTDVQIVARGYLWIVTSSGVAFLRRDSLLMTPAVPSHARLPTMSVSSGLGPVHHAPPRFPGTSVPKCQQVGHISL